MRAPSRRPAVHSQLSALPRPRLRYAVAAAVCLAAVAWLLVAGLSRNIVYFRTVSEAVEGAEGGAWGRFRLAGEVVPGSVRETGSGVTFRLTDGQSSARVVHHGDPPQLFAEGVPVVAEGHWKGGRFVSDRLLIRHGNEYRPPEADGGREGSR